MRALSHTSKTISVTLVPASAQAISLDPRIKPLNCASQCSPFPRVCGLRYEEGTAEKGRPGLGQGRVCKSQAREQPWKKTLERHAAPSTP